MPTSSVRRFGLALLAALGALLATQALAVTRSDLPLGPGRRLLVALLIGVTAFGGDLAGWQLVAIADYVGDHFESPASQSAARIATYLLMAALFAGILFVLAWALRLT